MPWAKYFFQIFRPANTNAASPPPPTEPDGPPADSPPDGPPPSDPPPGGNDPPNDPPPSCPEQGSDSDQTTKTGSSVQLMRREYWKRYEDISVKGAGPRVRIGRSYYGEAWHWDHERHNLRFEKDAQGVLEKILKGRIPYKKQGGSFVSETALITPIEGGYQWRAKGGEWKKYNKEGKLLVYGNRLGKSGEYFYNDAGRLMGVKDRSGAQVLWFEYDPAGALSAVSDAAGRRVSYTFTNGRLSKVTYLSGKEALYGYDAKGRLNYSKDAAGQEQFITYDVYGRIASVLDTEGKGKRFSFAFNEGTRETTATVSTTDGREKAVTFNRSYERTFNKVARTVFVAGPIRFFYYG